MLKARALASLTATSALVAFGALVPTVASAAPNEFGQEVTTGQTAGQLASSLASKGIEVSGATYTGHPASVGSFSGFGDTLGVDKGVVLSSGAVATNEDANTTSVILGPNANDGTSHETDEPGDADLDKIVKPDKTNDAAVLEFDFVPEGNGVEFNYVFGSDEYNEYVGAYNDVFSLYVNGKNCALIPGAKDPVSIDNVNNDKNAKYYVDNDGADEEVDTELDGFTKKLACNAKVNAGEKNHIKLAIADTKDRRLDSAVLIEAGSIKVNNAPEAKDRKFTTTEREPVATALQANDPDGDKIEYTVESKPKHGKVTGKGKDLKYTPEKGFTGKDTFTYIASDGALESDPATVTVTVKENKAPIGKADTFSTDYMTLLKVNGVLDNDKDPEGKKLTAKKASSPEHGSLNFNADGTFSYTPEYDFSGTDTFTYTASDGVAKSKEITVKIKVGEKPPALPATGASSTTGGVLFGGLGLLALGAFMIIRRRTA